MNELRRIRKARGFTQPELAKRAGVGLSTVVDAEAGRHTPRLENLEKIAGALDIEVAELLPKEDAPQPDELTLEWLLSAHNRDRHTALVASTAEERERLVREIDAALKDLEARYEAALTDAEREAIMERAGRVGMMRALATFGPAVKPVRMQERLVT